MRSRSGQQCKSLRYLIAPECPLLRIPPQATATRSQCEEGFTREALCVKLEPQQTQTLLTPNSPNPKPETLSPQFWDGSAFRGEERGAFGPRFAHKWTHPGELFEALYGAWGLKVYGV